MSIKLSSDMNVGVENIKKFFGV